nr:DUF433 domain-containing protein [Chamaesiphon sp. OTE_20_metabat_361]
MCGGDACISSTRIPVWVLVNARNLGISEAQLLKDYPTISATDLTNAWVYATVHPEEIELAIRENEELDAEFDRWEAAGDEDEAQIKAMLEKKGA